MVPDQPLFFAPVFRSYLWGGDRLRSRLNKAVPDGGRWAESWEVVDHGDDQSVVRHGTWQGWSLRQLIESFPQEILGINTAEKFPSFPLLLKYLDCNNVLSVQVHPDDTYAKAMIPPDLGKTEAWFIVDADDDAILYAGLRPGVDHQALAAAIRSGRTEECLHVIQPSAGDCVFIPAGTVHALGSGLIVAEIQQASDTTFRLFDWNRTDAEGNSRPLHIEQALEVIDFSSGPIVMQPRADLASMDQTSSGFNRSCLVDCEKFQLFQYGSGELQIAGDDAFHILTVPKGGATLRFQNVEIDLPLGESVLLPAASTRCSVTVGEGSILLSASLPVQIASSDRQH